MPGTIVGKNGSVFIKNACPVCLTQMVRVMRLLSARGNTALTIALVVMATQESLERSRVPG
jgi:hypothetical protein